MTREELLVLAEQSSAKQQISQAHAMLNTPVKTEDRIRAAAAYRIAQDEAYEAERKYQEGLKEYIKTLRNEKL